MAHPFAALTYPGSKMMRYWLVLLSVVCASPLWAQSIDERRAACEAGDQVACAVVRAFENATESVFGQRGDGAEESAVEPPQPEVVPAPPRIEDDAAPVPPSDAAPAGKGLAWWQKLLIACGVLYLLSGLVRGVLRATAENDIQDVWSGDPLPLPKILPGRRLDQGQLDTETDPTRQIVAWDTARVMEWVDAERRQLEPDITDPDIALHARLASAGEEIPDDLVQKIRARQTAMLDDTRGDEDVLWKDIDTRYYNLVRARYGITGGAYLLANLAYYRKQTDLPNDLIYGLWRLDADRDFNPAAVNMWALINENRLYEDDFVDIPTCEVYLRHFFNLGAPDGHFHIAGQVLNFYVASPYLREDNGYVAAAMDRVRSYDKISYNDWIRFMERNKLKFDLEDQSVSREGVLLELEIQKAGAIQ